MAKQGWFAGFGDFEPAAVAGVAGLAERSPPAAGRVASQLLEGVGQLGWPLAQAAKPKRVDGAGGRRMAPHPTWFTPQRDRTGNSTPPGPMAGQGVWPDLSLGLKPQVLNLTWEILTIRRGGGTMKTSLSYDLSRR